tara:strand:+ start:6042 stop:6386 length:345 start_codon:yes stop_codon:yes gene_type:complete
MDDDDNFDDDEDTFNPEQLPDDIRSALAEVFNLAAGVADLQADDASATSIYDLLNALSEYFGIEVGYVDDGELPMGIHFVDASDDLDDQNVQIQITDKKDLPKPDRDFGPDNSR